MTRPGEYLRQNRIKIALWVAVIEGVLVIVHLIPHLAIYVVAVVAVFFYAAAGRNYKSALGRQLAWIFAASQAATVLIPRSSGSRGNRDTGAAARRARRPGRRARRRRLRRRGRP